MNTNKFESLTKLFPLFSVLLILFGFFDLYSYYLFFGINIYPYLNSSEIIFSFLPKIYSFFILSTFIFIVGIFVWAVFLRGRHVVILPEIGIKHENSLADKINNLKWSRMKELSFSNKIRTIFDLFKHSLVAFFLFTLAFTIIILPFSDICEDPDILIIILGFWTTFFGLLMHSFFRENQSIRNATILIVIFFFMSIFYSLKNSCKVQEVKNGESDIHISFLFEQTEISTDSITHYIGSTQNYIFLYDEVEESNNDL